jgi:hypothetical protein
VSEYINYLLWSRSENTGPVTPDHKLRFQRASEGYARVYEALTSLNEKVEQLEQQLRQAHSSWIPGMLPLEIK